MRITLFILVMLLVACNNNETGNSALKADTLKFTPDSTPVAKIYANKRFRDVTVKSLGGNKFRITGQAQIFEATFNWIVEDGHNELKKGFQMTDAGAPEWGKFDFTIEIEKKSEDSTLMLILFESSAKDGSPQHELPIVLD